VIQWLTKNSGAVAGPRLSRQVAAKGVGVGELRGARELVRGFLGDALEGQVVPGCGTGAVFGQEYDALIAVDHLAQRRPAALGRPAVGELAQSGLVDGGDEVLGLYVVLVDDHDDFAWIAHEEIAQIAERIRERRGAVFAERMTEIQAALAAARGLHPFAQPQGGGDGLRAHRIGVCRARDAAGQIGP
jgi:hypothetical protein